MGNIFQTIFYVFSILLLLSCSSPPPQLILPETPPDTEQLHKGRELVRGLAACGHCHGDMPKPESLLVGGLKLSDRYGEIYAPNITQSETGIGGWSSNQIERAIRASKHRDGSSFDSELHKGFEWMSDSDLNAIVAYLKTMRGISRRVEKRDLGFIDRNTTGFFVSGAKEVKGFIADISKQSTYQYGRYLADNVARCSTCHDGVSSIFEGGGYLSGGKEIVRGDSFGVSPSITSSEGNGIGGYSEEQIVNYLMTGYTPDRRESNSQLCPWEFYANAPNSDLKALAFYLKRSKAVNQEDAINIAPNSDGVRVIGGKNDPKVNRKLSDQLKRY